MKVKPIGTRVFVEIKSTKHVEIANVQLEVVNQDEKKQYIYVKALGDKVDIDVKVGDKVQLFSNSHITGVLDMQDCGLIDQADIWAVLEED